jgi:hypothetical protein
MLCGTPFPAGRKFWGMQLRRFVVWKKVSGHINGTGVICVIIYENMRLASIIL